MRKGLVLIWGIALLASGCRDSARTPTENHATAACLKSKNYAYETLLTKADIGKHIAIDEGTFEAETASNKDQYGYCQYEWASERPDRTVELLGQTISVPDLNRVKLTGLYFYTEGESAWMREADAIAVFEQKYKKLSPSEYEQLLGQLEKQYANDPAGFAQAKGFLDARKNLEYEPVAQLGTQAYWKWASADGVSLVVLVGAASFEIESKTTGEAGSSLDDAVKFAREVLAKCGG